MPLTLPNPRTQERWVASCSLSIAPCSPSERSYEAPAAVRLWHLASLDAPSVAVVWSLAFAWMARVRLPLWVLALQALVVWAVYVGDRLLDARAGLRRWGSGLRERHFFHWRYRRVLAPLAVIASCAAAGIVLRWMPVGVRERDSVLAVASLAYFSRVHAGGVRRVLSKELLVGVLFTVGCALPVWSRAGLGELAGTVLFFAALAWLNCAAIERWEADADGGRMVHRVREKRSGEKKSMSLNFAPAGAGRLLAACGAAMAFLMVAHEPRAAALLVAGAASALLLAWLDSARARMSAVTLRAAADLVLLVPAVLLAAAWLGWR